MNLMWRFYEVFGPIMLMHVLQMNGMMQETVAIHLPKVVIFSLGSTIFAHLLLQQSSSMQTRRKFFKFKWGQTYLSSGRNLSTPHPLFDWNRLNLEIKVCLMQYFAKLNGDKLSPLSPIWSVGPAVKYRRAAKLCIGERYDARANGSASLPVDEV